MVINVDVILATLGTEAMEILCFCMELVIVMVGAVVLMQHFPPRLVLDW